MDGVEIIPSIVKYFSFQQLCIAERINSNFRRCIVSELRFLKYIDFGTIFTRSEHYDTIIEKIRVYCANLRHGDDIKSFSSRLTSEQSLRHMLNIRNKSRSLEIDSDYAEHVALYSDSNPVDSEQLDTEQWDADNDELVTSKIENLLLENRSLTKLTINYRGYDTWIDLPVKNLVHLDMNFCFHFWNPGRYEQLLKVIASNQNLEILKLSTIYANDKLIDCIFQLKRLNMLSLILENGRGSEYSVSRTSLHALPLLNNFEEFAVLCRFTESGRNFLSILLPHCPGLKRCYIKINDYMDKSFYERIVSNILHPEIIECCSINDECNIREAFSKRMVNMKHYHVDVSQEQWLEGAVLSRLQSLKFLHFSFDDFDTGVQNLKMLCSISLQGLRFDYDRSISFITKFIDIIFEKCPNLRYFSTSAFPFNRLHALPFKLPNLEFLEIVLLTEENGFTYYEEDHEMGRLVGTVIENLHKLRVLIVSRLRYEALSKFANVARLCRRGQLLIRASDMPNNHLHRKWLEICTGSCCAERRFTSV